MLSQHLSGHRPMSLAAATAYAKGFGVSLAEISPRLASTVAEASMATGSAPLSSAAPIPSPPAQWPFEVAQERLKVLQKGDWATLNTTIKTMVELREKLVLDRRKRIVPATATIDRARHAIGCACGRSFPRA